MKKLYSVSERLKELRAIANISQEEFAEHAEMNYKFYQQVESGKKKLIRLDTLQRLSNAYGIELWEFFHPGLPQIKLKLKKNINSSLHKKKHTYKN